MDGKTRAGQMIRTMGLAAALAGLGMMAAVAQEPGAGMGPGMGMGMGPHRPPMERVLGAGGQFGRWWNNPRLVEKFKLTDAQRKSMDDIYQQHRMTLIDLHANLEKAEASMEPLISQDQPDETKILAQIDKVAQARAELEKANARMLLDLRRQLTPEQWKDVKAAWAARAEGHSGSPGMEGPRWRGRGGQGNGAAPNAPDGGQPPAPDGPGEEE